MFEDDDRFHGNARRDLMEDLDAIDFACAMKDFKSTQKKSPSYLSWFEQYWIDTIRQKTSGIICEKLSVKA